MTRHTEHQRDPNHPTPLQLARLSAMAAASAVTSLVSPRTSTRLIRQIFTEGARHTIAQMERLERELDVDVIETLLAPQHPEARTARVFRDADADDEQPVVLWVHGGAWVAGAPDDVVPYARLLAARGFTTVVLEYPLAPDHRYPDALASLAHSVDGVLARAGSVGIDRHRVLLAGDSAGAQLVTQLAIASTSSTYRPSGISSPIPAADLRGMLLYCGVYDLHAMARLRGVTGWGFRVALWAYTGRRNWAAGGIGDELTVVDHVTDGFPPTLIAAGAADELTATQSIPMRDRLRALAVPVEDCIEPSGGSLPHEGQFYLDRADARALLDRTVRFADAVVQPAERAA